MTFFLFLGLDDVLKGLSCKYKMKWKILNNLGEKISSWKFRIHTEYGICFTVEVNLDDFSNFMQYLFLKSNMAVFYGDIDCIFL